MTPDDHLAAPARLRPETAVICAGRPGHAVGEPLNVPIVLASNFHADSTEEDSRAYSRTDATPGWEALETAVGQVEGGHAVAFSSGMAAIAAVLDLPRSSKRMSPSRPLGALPCRRQSSPLESALACAVATGRVPGSCIHRARSTGCHWSSYGDHGSDRTHPWWTLMRVEAARYEHAPGTDDRP